jgi:cobalt/nickel transport system permease protein
VHFSALDTFVPGESPVHRLDPRVKVMVTMITILAIVLTPDGHWVAFAALQMVTLTIARLTRIGVGCYLRRSAVALPFALAALTVAFATPGDVLWRWRLIGYPLSVTLPGLIRFASILIRSLISVQVAVLLAGTTKFPDILLALRWLRVPSVLVAIAGFLYRYLFVLADEAQRMMRAREARSGARSGRGGGRIVWRARVAGGMAGSLFIRSYERSERIYDAMVARGYDGDVRALGLPAMGRFDILIVFIAIAGLVAIVTLTRVLGSS